MRNCYLFVYILDTILTIAYYKQNILASLLLGLHPQIKIVQDLSYFEVLKQLWVHLPLLFLFHHNHRIRTAKIQVSLDRSNSKKN